MLRTRIKICGITRPEDATCAAAAGADAIGMVFHPPAPRNVPPARAAAILAALPPFVTPVGLFVDPTPEQVRQIATPLGLRTVQLHGQELPEFLDRLRDFILIKALRVRPDRFVDDLGTWRDAIRRLGLAHLAAFVLETPHPTEAGGTGAANNWDAIRAARAAGAFDELPPIIAAGGLTPQTVGQVVRDLRPYAVDVSSGVEESKGVKSPAKVAAFAAAVREADAG